MQADAFEKRPSVAERDSFVLCVDVGNSRSSFGLFAWDASAQDEPLARWESSTLAQLTSDDARLSLLQVLSLMGSDLGLREGELRRPRAAILSCVVPSLVEVWAQALSRVCERRPLVVGPGLKTGLKMRYRDPAEIGPDRIADALAARERYGAPVIALDLGTTLNVEAVGEDGSFLGGIIAPGLDMGARALSQDAARLPVVELGRPGAVIGRSTREAMLSGIVLGEVARMEGLVARVQAELGQVAPVVITGTRADELAELVSFEAKADANLTFRGLHQLFLQNERTAR